MVKKLLFLFSFAMILVRESTLNWQSEGNMTSDNMTVIKNYIQKNFSLAWTYNQASGTVLRTFAVAFSTELNRQWDQAWNVFVVFGTSNNNQDAVVYGYAFRNHWYWFNGLKFSNGYYASIVLWKDYNCKQWRSFAQGSGDTYNSYATSSQVSSAVGSAWNIATYSNPDNTNIWQAVFNIGVNLENDYRTKALAFATVGYEGNNAKIFGSFCAVDYASFPYIGIGKDGSWGKVFVLQTR